MKSQRRGKLIRSTAVESPNESSSDEKSDDDQRNLGSKLNLLRTKRKSSRKSSSKSEDESENTIVHIESVPEQQELVQSKGPSIAQSLKRRFGFFRKSDSLKSRDDVEAAAIESVDTSENKGQTLDVVVDVHYENDKQNTTNDETEIVSQPVDSEIGPKNLELSQEEEEIEEVEIESELTNEILPTSGDGEFLRRRKRWDKISADDLVEDLKKPKRKQWAKGAASAEIRQQSGKKIVVPKRSATAEPQQSIQPKSTRSTKPVAAPRSKSLQREEALQAYDNDGFSSDHDEFLRIEKVNDQSPKIKIGRADPDAIEDGASTLSEEEAKFEISSKRSIEEIKEIFQETSGSTDVSDKKDQLASEALESPKFMEKRIAPRKRLSTKKKPFIERKYNGEEEEDEEDEEEEQETVLDMMERKSKRSSSSSKVDIIPSNFFQRESSDETTISTNDEMHTSRRDSHLSQRSRPRSKGSRRDDVEVVSDRSSRSKRKTTSSSARNSAEEYPSTRKKTKSRAKKRHKKREKEKLQEVEEELKYISVKVHRSDILEADYITRHPMVKVHIVNADTGEYLKVRNKDESESGVLVPIITRKFDFKEKKSMVPVWEEELIFEQDFKALLIEGKGAVIVLFEIIDLLSFSEASVCYDQFGKDSCWYKVAWAFLRPVGVSGIQHLNKIVRLQLYRPKKTFGTFRKSNKNKHEVYKWWKSGSRDKYPSSLYITLSSIDPPKIEPVLYEQLLQLNDLSEMRSDSQNILSMKSVDDASEPPKWTRHAAQSCQIPNETYLETEASDNGCFYVAFSNSGKYLACALSDEYDYPIWVYKIDEGKIHVQIAGHKNFIYSLSWSHDDRYLLSVSSDQTARLWDIRERIIEHIQTLPHPSYVYCGKFWPDSSTYVVTGCYDHVARIWAKVRTPHSRQYELVQELEGHSSFVNAICFQPKDEVILTGDGVGIVILWMVKKTRKSPIRREWQMARKIKIKELDGAPVNSIVLHPLGSRLLVHSRNGGLKLIDLNSGIVVKKFEGLKNHRIQITACISPCGNLLFCGNEDSSLSVWSIESGKLLAYYEVESHEKAITCVDYHPYDHVMAFAVYGAPVPVKILKYDRESDGKNVGLKLLAITSSVINVSSSARMIKDVPASMRNGGRNLTGLSARSLNSSTNVSRSGSVGRLLAEYKDDEEVRNRLKGKLQRFIESGPNIKAKSMNRLNGIIEKIDRILMYATSQRSPAMDVESARNTSTVFTVEEKQPRSRVEMFELQDYRVEHEYKRKKKKHRQRSRSARNACSPTPVETEFAKAFSDSAAFSHKVSRFSDDSSNSNHSHVHSKFIVNRLALDKVDCADTESGFKDSLDTIVDGKEDFPSEEILDLESLKSDDTYTVKKEIKSTKSETNDSSDISNATFVIDKEAPIPKPRRKAGRIAVM